MSRISTCWCHVHDSCYATPTAVSWILQIGGQWRVGVYNLHSRMMRRCVSAICYPVVILLRCLHGTPEFHEAKLCIIKEKGDLRLPKNYRPICLLDVASKVISDIIADGLCQSVLKLHGLDEQMVF